MFKLEHAATNDDVALSTADLDVLARLRQARNDVSHGRDRSMPAHSDLRKGIGIANRLLLTRLRRLALRTTPSGDTPRKVSNPSRQPSRPAPPPSQTFTLNDKRWAEQAAEAMVLMLPYVESGEPIPGAVQSELRKIYRDATGEAFVVGMMRACDVAVKHLAKHFLSGALDHAAAVVGASLAKIGSDDAAGLGSTAYEDGAHAIRLMTEAMAGNRSGNFLEELQTSRRLHLAFNAVLIALLFELAGRYGIPPSRAAARLGQEISTITPKETD